MLIVSTSKMLISATVFVPAHFNTLPDASPATVSTCSRVYLESTLAREVNYFLEQNSWILMINKVPGKQPGSDPL